MAGVGEDKPPQAFARLKKPCLTSFFRSASVGSAITPAVKTGNLSSEYLVGAARA